MLFRSDWAGQLAGYVPPPTLGEWRVALVREVGAKNTTVGFVDGSEGRIPFAGLNWARRWIEGQKRGGAVQRASDVVKALNERYPQDVRLVYRQFPLENIHPHARLAAEASLCADDQERFWDYHDKLFQNSRQLAQENLVAYAKELELDMERFEKCLSERAHRDRVEADLAEGSAAGVTETSCASKPEVEEEK